MKKLVAEQTVINDELKTTDHGSGLSLIDTNVTRFSVELNKNTKQIKMFVESDEVFTMTMDDHTRLEKIFSTLLQTVKQKLTFWKTN